MSRQLSHREMVIIQSIIASVKYQLYEAEERREDQKSELIIEVEMRWLFSLAMNMCIHPRVCRYISILFAIIDLRIASW